MNFDEFLLGLLICFLLSFLLGIERQYRRRLLGLRTMILVSVGSYLFVSFSFLLTGYQADATRIAAQVVSGIGFLGAGSILITSRNQIKGLTTAACLWACACMGISIGVGFYTLALIGFALAIVILFFLAPIEKRFTKYSRTHRFHIELEARTDLKALVTYLRELEIKIESIERNAAYANSGLSVYTMSVKNNKVVEINDEFFNNIKQLPYVNFVEEIF